MILRILGTSLNIILIGASIVACYSFRAQATETVINDLVRAPLPQRKPMQPHEVIEWLDTWVCDKPNVGLIRLTEDMI